MPTARLGGSAGLLSLEHHLIGAREARQRRTTSSARHIRLAQLTPTAGVIERLQGRVSSVGVSVVMATTVRNQRCGLSVWGNSTRATGPPRRGGPGQARRPHSQCPGAMQVLLAQQRHAGVAWGLAHHLDPHPAPSWNCNAGQSPGYRARCRARAVRTSDSAPGPACPSAGSPGHGETHALERPGEFDQGILAIIERRLEEPGGWRGPFLPSSATVYPS